MGQSHGAVDRNVGKHKGKTVAIFADYDGCWDFAAAANNNPELLENMNRSIEEMCLRDNKSPLYTVEQVNDMLMDFVDEITMDAKRVILFVGSNRQSEGIELINIDHHKNGHSMNELRKLAAVKGWEFNDARLDKEIGNAAVQDTFKKGSAVLKREMAENNFKELDSDTEVYFFDDVKNYLDKTLHGAKIPSHIHFHTVWFKPRDLILGNASAEEQLRVRDSNRGLACADDLSNLCWADAEDAFVQFLIA